jgi:type II secretory pathway pseudopilin PulG
VNTVPGARPPGPGARWRQVPVGFSFIELLLVIAILMTMSGAAFAAWTRISERLRAVGVVRAVSTVLQRARGLAVASGANVAVRFVDTATGIQAATYVDGNDNGVTAADVLAGIDTPVGPATVLTEFGDAGFGLWPGLSSPDGEPLTGDDPIRVGRSRMISFSPFGTCSPGSVYIKGGGRQQYVIRVYGDTGKTRALRYARPTGVWVPL